MGSLSKMNGDYAANRISKTALNAVTTILAAELRATVGLVGSRLKWGAECPQDLTGKFLRDRKVIPW
jgi:hypothetical protein